MYMTRSELITLFRDSYRHWNAKNASRMSAALSYYTIFSLIPLLSLIILIAGYSLGAGRIQYEITREIGSFAGIESARFVDSLLAGSTRGTGGLLLSIGSLAILAVGTLGMLRELKGSMDTLWDAPPKDPNRPWIKTYISTRLISLSVIPVLVFLFVLSVTFSTAVSFLGVETDLWVKIGNTIFSVAVTSVLFAFIYHYLPSRKLPWREVRSGAIVTALLLLGGKVLIGLYIARYGGASAFGAAGALVAILIWLYYSVQLFYFGASMTYVWSRKYGYLKNRE